MLRVFCILTAVYRVFYVIKEPPIYFPLQPKINKKTEPRGPVRSMYHTSRKGVPHYQVEVDRCGSRYHTINRYMCVQNKKQKTKRGVGVEAAKNKKPYIYRKRKLTGTQSKTPNWRFLTTAPHFVSVPREKCGTRSLWNNGQYSHHAWWVFMCGHSSRRFQIEDRITSPLTTCYRHRDDRFTSKIVGFPELHADLFSRR